MTSHVEISTEWRRSPWRYAMWAMAAVLILVALLAFEAVRQGEYALVITAGLFALGCAIVERAGQKSAAWAYRAGVALAVLTGLGQVWMNLAVGLIGSEDSPINLMFFAIVLLALVGSLAARGRATGMAWAMAAAALAQVVAGAVGIGMQIGDTAPQPEGIIFLTLYFGGLWLNAAALFRIATRTR
jgi:hypothetical protein